MITAVFNDKMDYTIAYGLWQWDYGQVLRVKGLDFDQISIEVHFSLSPNNTNSLVTIGVVKDVDYQSTIVSDGEEYTVNETATVLDVVIPKDMLWNNIKKNYTIYVFLLSTNEESGETLKRIIMPVKVKPKPLYSVTPEDEELFHRVVEEVNTFAETAKEHSNISKSYAVGNTGTRENENIDNAKYYAEQSALSAEASEQSASNALISENHALDSENSALGAESRARTYATEARDLKQEYDNTLALAKEYKESAQTSAMTSSLNLQDTINARNIATQASLDANGFLNQTRQVYTDTVTIKSEIDDTKSDIDSIKNSIDNTKNVIDSQLSTVQDYTAQAQSYASQANQIKTDVTSLKNDTILIKEETSDIKDDTAELKQDVIDLIDNIPTSTDVEDVITEHNISSVAHNDIRSLITSLSNTVSAFLDSDNQSLDQLSEIVAFIQNNKTLIEGITTSKVDKNQGVQNADKALIVGVDGLVTVGDITPVGTLSYYPVTISIASNGNYEAGQFYPEATYEADHTCIEINEAFNNNLIPIAFVQGLPSYSFHLMTCSNSNCVFVHLSVDNVSVVRISLNGTVEISYNVPLLHTHQDISNKADKSEIPTVPTNVSAFTNDSGYINDLSSYIYYSQNSNTVYINSATEITDADEASF